LVHLSTLLRKFSRRFTPAHSLATSFIIVISIGTFFLSLPMSAAHGKLTFLNALFTATSATCVTGLVVVDTGSTFSQFGQMIILILIQVGGIGIITFSTYFAYLIIGKLSVREHVFAEQALGRGPFPKIGRLFAIVVSSTFIIELIGAVVLFFAFSQYWPSSKAAYLAVFHAISAFCNAGFSLFPNSLENYRGDIVINLTVMSLIITGGIGFWIFVDLKNVLGPRRLRALTVHSRIVLKMTFSLLLIGSLAILFFEWNNALKGFSPVNKFLAAAFQATTTRTAGFNTLPINGLTSSTLFLMMILMMIGASPGSCGGGIKTTTFAVLIAMISSKLKDEKQVRLLNRGIPDSIVSKAISIAFFWLVAVTVVVMALLITEHPGGLHELGRTLFLDATFEAFSAMGTVGLTTGLTPTLSAVGKVLIVLLMYIGRIGPVTMALAVSQKRKSGMRLAEEKILVG
jgi:trk system potassium uptake protein TrkH